MKDTPFLINEQFYVDPALGLVIAQDTGVEIRLEPRLMHLLCLLSASHGKLVNRELLTREVWDDYGNADEGLTQAISYLRKILNDGSKKLIETVPKKGYVLNAEIKTDIRRKNTKQPLNLRRKILYWLIAVLVLLASISLYVLRNTSRKGEATTKSAIPTDKLIDSANNKPSDGLNKGKKNNTDKAPDTNKSRVTSLDSKK